jgi:GAF domain-containing protein
MTTAATNMDFSSQQTDEGFSRFASVLRSEGLRSALASLLLRTDYRFIAIFRFQGDNANAAAFYDREHPETAGTQEVPAGATYCAFARDSGDAFITADAMTDPRLAAHVSREQIRAYCRVPIVTPDGAFLGTLCHYDVVPRDPSQVDLALMCQVASALEQGRYVPQYPATTALRA